MSSKVFTSRIVYAVRTSLEGGRIEKFVLFSSAEMREYDRVYNAASRQLEYDVNGQQRARLAAAYARLAVHTLRCQSVPKEEPLIETPLRQAHG